jgi:hypothetical protein
MSDVLPAPEGECISMTRADSNELATYVASRSRPKNNSFSRNGRGPTYGFSRLAVGSSCDVATEAGDEDDQDGGDGNFGLLMMRARFFQLLEKIRTVAPVNIQAVGAEVVL